MTNTIVNGNWVVAVVRPAPHRQNLFLVEISPVADEDLPGGKESFPPHDDFKLCFSTGGVLGRNAAVRLAHRWVELLDQLLFELHQARQESAFYETQRRRDKDEIERLIGP